MINPLTALSTMQTRLILLVLCASLLSAGATYVHHHIYQAGFDDGKMAGDLAIADANNKGFQDYVILSQKLITVEGKTKALEAQLSGKLQTVETTGQARVVTVEKIIHDHPDFASIARPDDLYQLRQQSLADIAADTAKGKAAAAKLSRPGLQALRGSSYDFDQYAGSIGSSGYDQSHALAGLYSDSYSVAGMRF